MLCIIALSCFFWRKCSTVVAVGVQTSFLLFAKSVTEKNNNRVIARRQAKRLCKPRGTRGEGFCLPMVALAELPVINFQAMPDCFLYFSMYDLLLLIYFVIISGVVYFIDSLIYNLIEIAYAINPFYRGILYTKI